MHSTLQFYRQFCLSISETERLAAENVHVHAPIHRPSVNQGLTMAPLGERRLLVPSAPLGAPREGELKGEG